MKAKVLLIIAFILIFLTGKNLELAALLAFQFLLWALFIVYQLNRRNILFLLFGFSFFLKFIFVPFLINLEGAETSSQFSYKIDSLIESIYISIIFFSSMFIGQLLVGNYKKLSFLPAKIILNEPAKYFMFFLVGVGIFISLDLSSILRSSTNRFDVTEGTGYLFFLGYSGYFITTHYINENFFIKKNLFKVYTIAIICGLFFLLRFHRGGFLYPLCFTFLTFFGLKYGLKKTFWICIILIPLLFELNIISSAIRTEYLLDNFSMESLGRRIGNMHQNISIPLAFGHVELLAKILDGGIQQYNYLSTLSSSLLNWIPRIIFEEKSITTGPTLGMKLFPDTRTFNGGYSSSLTTGLLVELFFNFKYYFALPAIFIGFVFQKLYYYVLRSQNLAYLIIFLWLFGFVIFYDDLGGWVNKVFICIVLTMGLSWINKIKFNV